MVSASSEYMHIRPSASVLEGNASPVLSKSPRIFKIGIAPVWGHPVSLSTVKWVNIPKQRKRIGKMQKCRKVSQIQCCMRKFVKYGRRENTMKANLK